MFGFLIPEHFFKSLTKHFAGFSLKDTKLIFKPFQVYGSDLIDNQLAQSAFEPAFEPRWIIPDGAGQRNNNNRIKVLIGLIRGNHHTRPYFIDFMTHGGIQLNIPDFESFYHVHSSSSNALEIPSK